MTKGFQEELKEALEALKDSEAEKFFKAIEDHKFPSLPMTPPTVLRTVREVVKKHNLTSEELVLLIQTTPGELTADEFALIEELTRKED